MNAKKRFASMLVDNEVGWFISCEDIFPGLYRVDLTKENIECMGEIPWDDSFNENAAMGKSDNMIIIAPRWHKRKFVKYNVQQSSFECVYLNQDIWIGDYEIAAFSNVVTFQNVLYFIGNKSGIIVEYQRDSDKFYIHNIVLPQELEKQDLSFFWNSAVVEEDKLFLPIKKGGLLEINLNNFSSEYFCFPNFYECFSISKIDNCFWIMPYNDDKVMIYNFETRHIDYIYIPVQRKSIPFITAIDFESEVLLLPMVEETVYSINKSSRKVSIKEEYQCNVLEHGQYQRQFLAIYGSPKGDVYLQKNGTRDIWIFKKDGHLDRIDLHVLVETVWEIFENSKAKENMIWSESLDVSLEFVIENMKKNKPRYDMPFDVNGRKVWEYVKKI